MKRIALRWLGALLLSITLAAPALAAGKHLINGIDANYPPTWTKPASPPGSTSTP